MNSPIYRKIRTGLALFCIVILILFPDVIIELSIEILHFLFEFLYEAADLLYEIVESTLDKIVEHLFHTELQATQVIVFYLMLLPGIFLVYFVLRKLILLFRRVKKITGHLIQQTKGDFFSYWHQLTLLNRIKLLAISLLSLYVLTLFWF